MPIRLDEFIDQGNRADVKDEKPVGKGMRLGDFLAQEKQPVIEPIPDLFQPSKEREAEWKEAGKIGYYEQATRMNKKRLIPFYFGDSVKTFKTWRAVNRLTADSYKNDKEAFDQDVQTVNNFLELLSEEQTRGFTAGGRITQGIGELPAFLTEFLLTGGIANLGKEVFKRTIQKSLRTIAKSATKKFATRIAGGVVKSVFRTAAMPHRVLQSGSQKALYAKLEFTDKGYELLEEATEAPAISFLKGYGDVVIENFSEEAGFYLGKYANKLLPRRLTSGMGKLYKKFHPNESVSKFLKNTRVWNGFLNEMGEERLGDFLRAVFKVEDFGAKTPESMVDRIISSWPNGEEFMIEAAVLSVPGAANMLASNAINRYRTLTGKKAEIDDMPEELDRDMSDKEIDTFVAEQEAKAEKEAKIEAPKGVVEPKPGVAKVKVEPTKVPKPAITPIDRLARLEEREAERVKIEEEFEKAMPVTDILKGKVRRFKEGFLAEELREFPRGFFVDKPEAMDADEARELVNKELGFDIKNLRELAEVLISEQQKAKELRGQIEVLKPEKITRQDITVMRQKIADIQRGIREGKRTALKEAKQLQGDLIRILKFSDMEAKDKAKFIATIKNIQTEEQFLKALPRIDQKISRLVEAAEKRTTATNIKKELKTTKPLKVGQKRVGKFDYQTNKMFDTLRDYNKLNQTNAQVEFDKFPEEVTSEVDLIKKRFLSLKANGASASAEIHKQVLADIKRIKELGKKAKDEADLEKMLNRQELVENALASIDRITGTKKSIIGKITNAYRRGFSNIYSMLNSIGGKTFAEAYDPELSENKRNTATYKRTLEITVNASKIYNEKNIIKLLESMSTLDYEITDIKDGLTTELSKLEIIDIYNSIKNEKKRQDYYEAFGKDQVENLIAKLTANDVLFGDSLQETVQEYREILNKRNIEITGRDLGFIENYWPATSEFQVNVIDDMRVQGETPSALKERAKTRVIPIPKNAWYKAQRHVAQAEHVDKISREFEALKRLFTDRKVKHAMTQKYGEDVYNTLMAQIDNISLNKQTERIDAISSVFQRAINNWVTAKIALNPSTFVRQLMSVGNYAEKMNTAEWTAGFFKGIVNPVKTFNFVWNNAPFLEARFNKGYSEALKEAIEGAERISVNKRNWVKFLTSLVRSGDITAIIYGGFPLIQSELAKGKSMKEAVDTFEKATLKAQQSGLSSSVSQFQNSRNPFTRLFLAFKNTANQYFRKTVDAVISYQNKDISLGQFAKTMAIYAVIQPILYVSAGHATKLGFSLLGRLFGLKGDEEDFEELLEKFLNDIMIQLIVSPVNAMPIIDDAMRTAARKLTGQKIYQVFSTPLFDDLESGFRALTKKEVTGGDYLETATSILEPVTALPISTGIRYFEILTGKKISGKKTGKKLIR
jgi:hypothetical protein